MENSGMMTVEYYDGAAQDRLIGAVYVPEASANACANLIGMAILKAVGGNCLTAHLLDVGGNVRDMLTVFKKR